MNPIYSRMGTTIFEAMSARARASGAINLGQGFPEAQGPADILAAAARALTEKSNQYPPMIGLPELRQAVAAHYAAHQGLDLSPDEVVVTSGATEAIAAALLALVSPGDEVILFQPLYDAYLPLVERAGGVAKLARLSPPDWRITAEMLEAAWSPKTRLLVLNSPLNPSASMTDADELATIARFCIERDLIAICDEVWEALVFDGARHRPLMAEPGMRDRTVKIGSAGKMFALTGWKVGWMCAAPDLARGLAKAHQFLTFTTPPNLQWGATYGLGKDKAWFDDERAAFQRSRDRLAAGLRAAGFVVLDSDGTYFLNVDLAASGVAEDDRTFALRAVRDHGVASIPVSAFYAEDPVRHILRLCFAKADETLDEAVARLASARAAVP
ncbi:MAG TPA: aminotransferase [Caulobacter sp.]|nr:aminotransferase [Caulobacter sp.]